MTVDERRDAILKEMQDKGYTLADIARARDEKYVNFYNSFYNCTKAVTIAKYEVKIREAIKKLEGN